MVTVGIVAEFNPFHKGHKYIIDKARKITGADNVIVICSGNFVQRGEPAIFDKTVRTKSALANGVDAVFELPVYYSTASAETFARASVKFLTELGFVDYICFGSESDHIKILPTIANVLANEPAEYKDALKKELQTGLSFPKARVNALKSYFALNGSLSIDEIEITMRSPNNILAIEYIKAIKYFGSSIKPVAIKRIGADYSSLDTIDDYVSATAIRNQAYLGNDILNFIPENCEDYIKEYKPLFIHDFNIILGTSLINNNNFNEFYDINKDLANRINNQKNNYTDIEHFMMQLDSKNFTRTSISRSLFHILLNIKNQDIREAIEDNYFTHARLLGINRGSNLMSVINDNSNINIISRYSDYYRNASGLDKKLLDISLYADEIYRLAYMTKYKEIIPNEFERQIVVK